MKWIIEDFSVKFIFRTDYLELGERIELLRKAVSAIMLTLLLIGMLPSIFIIRPVKADDGYIYIRTDGSIDPPTAPIQRDGDIYTFTGNISGTIFVERSNIVIDGAGYTVQNGGIELNTSNVTVNNTNIKSCWTGISLYGLWGDPTYGSYTISNCTIVNNKNGIDTCNWTTNSIIRNNNIMSNTYGLILSGEDNAIYHNNFVNNTDNCGYCWGISNQWDDGYPPGGNYWSDYADGDEYSGPNQDEPGGDGIGDTPYVIDENNQDRYPLMSPFVSPPSPPTPTPPVANFTMSTTTTYTSLAILFNASSSYDPDGIIASYDWDFGDGKTGRGALVTHRYVDDGTYKVSLTVTDNQGLTGTSFHYVTVLNTPPTAIFTESAENVYPGETIHFDASQSYDPDGFIIDYSWDFGDGFDDAGVAVDHAYTDRGTYVVTLTVTDDDGATSFTSATKNVLNHPPIASFTDTATTVLTGEAISFDASASYDPDGYIVSYDWDFGDGTNATGVVVEHAYVDDGNYVVTLKVADNEGGVGVYSRTKRVLNRAPVALFTENATTVLTGEIIYFDASASYDLDGIIVNYLWDFGDGKKATGISVNHAYSNNGTYLVTLKVIDDDGASAISTSVKVILNRLPVALFSETAEVAPTGQNITFDATLSYDPDGTIVDYFWDFGDGATANGKIVNHAYFDNGTYTVMLVVTDDDGANASSMSTKGILNRPPVASFTQSAESVFTGEPITFNANNSYDPDGCIISYFWDFGNGASASGIFVNYSYAEDGTYTVTLAVTDDDGEYSVAYSIITARNRPPVASFTESEETVLTGEAIRFDASASYDLDGNIVSYFWDFGDGTNVTGMIVSHTYADNGIYVVTLTVTDNDGATDSVYATKTVLNRPPVASFTESAETVTVGEFITFNALSSFDPDGSIVSCDWDFGDGTSAIGVVVSHAYTVQGTYTVTLTVTDDDGATASNTAIKTVLKPPIASFTWAPLTPKVGEPVSFDGSASKPNGGTIVKYEWNFGDDGHAIGKAVIYTYSIIGTYNVTLKVTDSEGLWDTERKQIILNLDLPPDLAVSSPDMVFSDYNPSENQVITISATIRNVGEGNAKNVKVQFFDGDVLIGEDQISFISYHTSGLASVEWTAARQGFHLMKVIVDPSNAISETDEENNEATRSVLVGRLVGYGGIEISPSTYTYEAYPGQSLTVSGSAIYKLKYEKNGKMEYYSEPVAGANVTVTIIGEKWLWETHTIASGAFWVEIGTPYSVGTYEIMVEVTDFTFWEKVVYQLIVKQYEGGEPGEPPPEGIDLIPRISFDPNDPVENDDVMVTARVFNIGTVGASDVLVRFYGGGTIIGERMIDSIPAHDNRSTSIWWKAWSAGWHSIAVQVDPYNTILELNENNNIGSKKIYVYPAWPDLTPTRIEFSDGTPVVNQLTTITARVTNLGGVEANNVLVRFYDNDTFIGKHTISLISGKGGGRTALISHTFTTAGLHVIKVVVDPENNIIEAREDNNEYLVRIYVHLPSIDLTFPSYINADLRGRDITFSNSTPTVGDMITISSRILNVGELEANDVVVEFFDFDTEIGSVHVSSILGNSYQTVSISWNAFPEGLHKITVIIDPDDAIAESNEFNNKATRYINMYPPYEPPSDLYIYSEDIVFSNTNPDRGQDVIIYATVHNAGPATARGILVRFYIDNTRLTNKTISSLPAEASETISIRWTVNVGNGSHVVKVEIDSEPYAIRDPIRANNTATRAIIVGMPPPTPPVASFIYNPPNPIIDEQVTFNASDSHDLDGEIVSYYWDFGDSSTGDGVTVTHSYSTEGSYTVTLIVTDNDGATDTANEIIRVKRTPVILVHGFKSGAFNPLDDWGVMCDNLAGEADVTVWRENIKPGDILNAHNTGIFGTVIPGYWDHTAIYVGTIEIGEDKLPYVGRGAAYEEIRPGVYRIENAVVEAAGYWKGVVISGISSFDHHATMPSWEYLREYVELLRVDATDDVKQAAVDFAVSQVGWRYSIHTPRHPEPRDSEHSWGWYCSELVWAAYYNQGIDIDGGGVYGLVTPTEIDESPYTQRVSEHHGSINVLKESGSDELQRIERNGFVIYVSKYSNPSSYLTKEGTYGHIQNYARNLADEIDIIKEAEGVDKVDIVAHSMGGLVARWYMEVMEGGDEHVRKLIMLETPNHGGPSWIMKLFANNPDMYYQSMFLQVLNRNYYDGTYDPDAYPPIGWSKQSYPCNDVKSPKVHYEIIGGPLFEKFRSIFDLNMVYVPQQNRFPNLGNIKSGHSLLRTDKAVIQRVIDILRDDPEPAQPQEQDPPIQFAPLILDKISPNEQESHEILISSTSEANFILAWSEGDLNLTLTTPSGTLIDPYVAESDPNITYYQDEIIEGYGVKNPESGVWKVNVTAVGITEEEEYMIVTLLDTNITLSLELRKYQYDPSEPICMKANVTYCDEAVTNAYVTAKIQKPDGTAETITLYDDGLHGDYQADDGVYANTYTDTALWGMYDITVTATGTANNEQFARETLATVWMAQYPDLALSDADIHFSKQNPCEGETITINATIHNIGEADANNAYILFYDGNPADGTLIGKDRINVAAGQAKNASIQWKAILGTHEIYVLISPYNAFLEENYTNNIAHRSIEAFADTIPPTTQLTISEPQYIDPTDNIYVSSATPFILTAQDNPDGSGVAFTSFRIYNDTYDTGWLNYSEPFNLTELADVTYHIDYNSTDNAGNVELTNTATVILDNTPPTTTLTIGEPKFVTDMTYVTLETSFKLEANDNTGSGVYSTAYRISNSTYDSGLLPYMASFYLTGLADGAYTIEFNGIDNIGNVEPSNTATVILDNTGPSVTFVNPPAGWALQDGVTFIISAVDASGTSSMNFSIREADGGEGTPVGFEDLSAIYDAVTGKWTLFFDTLQLPDGYYVVLVKAEDNLGNIGPTLSVPYSIRNWAVLELLPASKNNKAGRTMPVKFALRVAASVDPNQPFVYNEDLTIKIYATEDPSNILQTSTFGDTARDYRINTVNELYITNFKTLKTPMQYTVTILRGIFIVGSFEFNTIK